jgi:hypothetical protein
MPRLDIQSVGLFRTVLDEGNCRSLVAREPIMTRMEADVE